MSLLLCPVPHTFRHFHLAVDNLTRQLLLSIFSQEYAREGKEIREMVAIRSSLSSSISSQEKITVSSSIQCLLGFCWKIGDSLAQTVFHRLFPFEDTIFLPFSQQDSLRILHIWWIVWQWLGASTVGALCATGKLPLNRSRLFISRHFSFWLCQRQDNICSDSSEYSSSSGAWAHFPSELYFSPTHLLPVRFIFCKYFWN